MEPGKVRGLDDLDIIAYTIDMLRTIIKPNASMINLSIPAEYIGEEIEILVFPVNSASNSQVSGYEAERQNSRRQEAFQNFMKYKGILPDNFDYKKELAEYRNGRYDHTD